MSRSKPAYGNNIYNRVFYFKTSDPEELRQVLTGVWFKARRDAGDVRLAGLPRATGDQDVRRVREFMVAFLAEMAGNNAEALSKFKALQAELQGQVTNSLLSRRWGSDQGVVRRQSALTCRTRMSYTGLVPMSIAVRSFAKINLGLKIGPVRADGFHELRTIYQTLALHDVVQRGGAERFRH